VCLWRHLKHAHILPLLGIFTSKLYPGTALLSPWLSQRTLEKMLQARTTNDSYQWVSILPRLFVSPIAHISQLKMAEAADALAYVHEKGLVHGHVHHVHPH
jgi:hypothetical protein